MNAARAAAIAALFFVSATALVGSVPLIIDPSGRLLMMRLSLLEHSPFTSFLVPGIILLTANGLLSFTVLVLVLRKIDHYCWWIVLQGCVMAGWITIQVLMIRAVIWAHYVYWITALVLIGCGLMLRNQPARAK